MYEITEQELNDLFVRANNEIKEAEQLAGEIVVPAINELRYGTEHRVRAQHVDSEEKRLSEFAKAREHFIRAAYDALEARILYTLDRFTKFQEKYSKFVGKEDLPAYIDAVNTAREIRKYLIDISKKSEYPDFDELKRKAIHLERQLERLYENRKFLIKSIEKSKRKAKHIAFLSILV